MDEHYSYLNFSSLKRSKSVHFTSRAISDLATLQGHTNSNIGVSVSELAI